jgi:hypothetical protein
LIFKLFQIFFNVKKTKKKTRINKIHIDILCRNDFCFAFCGGGVVVVVVCVCGGVGFTSQQHCKCHMTAFQLNRWRKALGAPRLTNMIKWNQ